MRLRSLHLDVLTRTAIFCVLFTWLLISRDAELVGIGFIAALVIALLGRVKWYLLLFSLLVPVVPILVSYFGIEPGFSGNAITDETRLRAAEAWARVGGMALLSITWIQVLGIRGAAQLSRALVLGQYLLLPLLTATTFIGVSHGRWTAIRELQALRAEGKLRKRTQVAISKLPAIGLQLTLASLTSAGELALACDGRGIGARRYLAVKYPRPSLLGLAALVLMVAALLLRDRIA